MIVTDAKNTWGSAGSSDVLQRTDLWQVDFRAVIGGLNQVTGATGIEVEPWDARSVTLPQRAMKVEPVRRDSRSYNMPSFDEPLEASKMVFLFSSKVEAESSQVHRLLTLWWQQVRAGRGSISGDGLDLPLNANYTLDFRWPIFITLFKGASAEQVANGTPLAVSSRFVLSDAWLSGFKVSDLSYEQGNQVVTIEATVQAESLERV